jgi:hypothetical protein
MSTALWIPSTPTDLIEQPNSPEWNFTDKISVTKTYRGPMALCISSCPFKGTLGTDTLAGYWVTTAKVTQEPGGIGVLQIVWEAYGIVEGQGVAPQVPPDEYSIEPFENNPDIRKNPRYSSLTSDEFDSVDSFLNSGAKASGLSDLANELLVNLRRGESNFYQAALRYSWTQSFFSISGTVSVGGFIETPDSESPLAD